MNRRRVLAILAAVLLTLFGTLILIAYVNRAEDRAREGAEFVQILVAQQDIPAGTPAEDVIGLTRTVQVPRDVKADSAVDDPAARTGEVIVQDVLAGTPLLAGQFGDSVQLGRAGAREIGEGREEISIALEAQRVLGGEIVAGDLVGVIVSVEGAEDDQSVEGGSGCAETAMVLSDVSVTDVRDGVDPDTDEGGGSSITVTFDVDDSDAELLAHAAEFGKIWLTRQTEDSQGGVDGRTVTCDDVFAGLGQRGG